ncbi:hypothetical protein PO909_010714 [Leuciscus waleckii]
MNAAGQFVPPLFIFPRNRMNGHYSHKTLEAVLLARERGVIMITIPPHCSHKMQPLDRTFFKSVKSKYNTVSDNWMTSHPGQRIDIYAVCGLFDKAYSASVCVGKGQKGFKACWMWLVDKTVYKDEDFEGAEVTEEPDPTLEDSREIEEEISAGPSGSSVVPSTSAHSQPQPGTSLQRLVYKNPSGFLYSNVFFIPF